LAHFSIGRPEQASEAHFGRWCFRAQQSISHHLTDHGAVFETMTRASANNPDVFRFRMAVQDEIGIAWTYAQTHALLSLHFGANHCRQKFVTIKSWIKVFCDGKVKSDVLANDSTKRWTTLFREDWRAPVWLRAWGSKYFARNPALNSMACKGLADFEHEASRRSESHIGARPLKPADLNPKNNAGAVRLEMAARGDVLGESPARTAGSEQKRELKNSRPSLSCNCTKAWLQIGNHQSPWFICQSP
jgi:hypothetical protein